MLSPVVAFALSRWRISRWSHVTRARDSAAPNQGAPKRKGPHQQSEGDGHEGGQGPQEAAGQAGTHQQPGLLAAQPR